MTLEDNVTDTENANAILLALADSVSAHLRSDGNKACGVSVSIRYLDFKTRSHQCTLDTPADTVREIYDTAKRLLADLWKDRRPLRLMGIALTNLTKEDAGGQMSLFDQETDRGRERDRRLDQTVDRLRSRFGYDIIQRGTVVERGIDVARKFKGSAV